MSSFSFKYLLSCHFFIIFWDTSLLDLIFWEMCHPFPSAIFCLVTFLSPGIHHFLILSFTIIVIDIYCQITLKIYFHYDKVDLLSLLYIYSGRHVLLGHFKISLYIFFLVVIQSSLYFFIFFIILDASILIAWLARGLLIFRL